MHRRNRRIFGCFEKTAINYLGMLHAATIMRHLREFRPRIAVGCVQIRQVKNL